MKSENETLVQSQGPGRVMDVMIHQQVMGLQCELFVPTSGPVPSHLDGWYDMPLQRTGMLPQPVPRYSTEISAAWEMVEELRSREYSFECRTLFNGEWAAVFHDLTDVEICVAGGVGYAHHVTEKGVLGEAPWEWPAKDKNIATAICRAALMLRLSSTFRKKEKADGDEKDSSKAGETQGTSEGLSE